MANLLWAYGKLKVHPGQAWASALLGRLEPLLAGCPPTSLGQALWGLASLGHAPPQSFVDAFLEAAEVGWTAPRTIERAWGRSLGMRQRDFVDAFPESDAVRCWLRGEHAWGRAPGMHVACVRGTLWTRS